MSETTRELRARLDDAIDTYRKAVYEEGERVGKVTGRSSAEIKDAENRGYETARKDITDLTNRMIELEAVIEGQKTLISELKKLASTTISSPSGKFYLSPFKNADGAFLQVNFHDTGHAFVQPASVQQLLLLAETFSVVARQEITEIERRHALKSRDPDDGSARFGSPDGSAIDRNS